MNYGTDVLLNGRVVMRSRNLRAMRDYARVSPVVRVETRKRKAHASDSAGIMTVTYANGATCAADFASHKLMIDFIRNRRTWRRAKTIHHDGSLGYLTSPGVLAP